MSKYRSGVLYGKDLEALYNDAKQNKFALPAINVISTNTINATLETAAKVNSPVIIQLSTGGSQFLAGKGMTNHNARANIVGAMSGALHVHTVSEHYGVPVVLHTDHASKSWLPWIDGLIAEGEKYHTKNNRPLFSSHMLDLSAEPKKENLEISVSYFKRLQKLEMGIEIELGITGGEEEGVDNSGVEKASLYTQPSDIAEAYLALRNVGSNFTIAASFGNVHGVYNPGNVELRPEILSLSQAYIREKYSTENFPVHFVFHGGSGSPKHQISETLAYGVVKMNIDTDLQWAFWSGVKTYYQANKDYLQEQLGNPEGKDKPNKKFYDARAWLRKGEESFGKRLAEAFEDLNCIGRNK